MKTNVTRYGHRNWAIYDDKQNLVAVTLYRKGAHRVAELLAALPVEPVLNTVNEEIEPCYIPQNSTPAHALN